MAKDSIYTGDGGPQGPFEFNDDVASVFPDMLQRSIPGYAMTVEAIGALARRYVRANTVCYDLGCSLGAATLAMRDNIDQPGCTIIAVDSSAAMVTRCKAAVAATDNVRIEVREADIREIGLSNASMIVLNYTLQFLPIAERPAVLRKIYQGLNDGGVLILSEKVADIDREIENLLVDLHHGFKRRNAYSELEISRKRSALENVLLPESIEVHRDRLATAGFRHIGVWLRHFNFVSIVAIR